MCEICDGMAPSAASAALLSPELIAAARTLDARRASAQVPDEAWLIFAGKRGGYLSWQHHQRIAESLALVAREGVASRIAARSPFRCE